MADLNDQYQSVPDAGAEAFAGGEEEVYVFPTSFAQQRMWFLDQFEPNSPSYNIPTAVRMEGPLDLGALERTFNEIARRHETLRTTFADDRGQPVQLIAPEMRVNLPLVDLARVPAVERDNLVRELTREEAQLPFNLSTGPLLRTKILRLAPNDHVLLLTMHHIVSDGWSMGVFVREMSILYDAFSHGRSSPLPDLPIQYADFAYWQRERLEGAGLAKQVDYWKRKLGGALPVLDLPADRPRPAVLTSNGATLSLTVPRDVLDDLLALARREGATLYMILLAAFQTLLYRYTGQTDVIVGSPIANRQRAEIEGLIGCFINTLALRADLSEAPSFLDLLRQVRQTTLEAYENQDLPFETLVEQLQPERDMSRPTLFQVMFILQNATGSARELPGLRFSQLEIDSGIATCDLTLMAGEGPDGLSLSLEYNTDLFEAATIERFGRHFHRLLESLIANPATSVDRLPLLDEAERRQLLVDWNRTEVEFSQDGSVIRLFEPWARITPDSIAVVWGDERVTYGELNERANRLANYLLGQGVGAETPIGICVERSIAMVVAALGVLKAGAAYVPMDPLYPADRLGFMIEETRMPLILTDESASGKLPAHRARTIDLGHEWALIARESADNPDARIAARSLAYVIYTSGSTGKPKGVMVEHANLLNAYRAWEQAYGLREVRNHLQMANFAFDVFSGDLVRALCSGGKLVLCPRETLLDPAAMLALMRGEEVECAEFVPAVLRLLAQYLVEKKQRLDFMRLLICGSDTLYVGEFQRFMGLCGPGTRVVNSFGLTEATIDSSFCESIPTGMGPDQFMPIGKPFANTQLYVLDRHLQPQPIGVTGELFVGGLGVARGYLNNPAATTEKFIEWPCEIVSSSPRRLYRTGDLARVLPDGNVQFLGRADFQVKIRGFRVEPGEVEAVLKQSPEVRDAVIDVRRDPRDADCLVAYLIPRDGAPTTSSALRRAALEKLPGYMVPSAFVWLERLPLTANGKVDRQALPAPDWSVRELDDQYVAPRNPMEETLNAIWRGVLQLERVGVEDNFFELGGHSLLATQVVSRVRDEFQVELPLRHIFEYPTVAGLADRIAQLRMAGSAAPEPPMAAIPRDGELPLSFAQQRLWFLNQFEPNSPSYNIPEAFRLRGPLDVAVFERGFQEIVRRHESLRTSFPTVDGKPKQVIAPSLRIEFPLLDLSDLPTDEREAEAMRLASEDAHRPFDLDHGPLLRASVLKLGDEDHIVLLTIHHIISDDWSSKLLFQEMAAIYDAYGSGRPSPLPPLALQYADYAHWQRDWLQGEVLERQLEYWKRQLGGSPDLLNLPTDRPRPAVQTFSGAAETFVLPDDLAARLREFNRREGATMFMTLLAAFQTLLSRYSGQEQVNVGTPIANRHRTQVEGIVGFFVNTLVMRGDLSGDPGFRELLKRTREASLGAYSHQDLPFEMIVDALQPHRDLSHSPLFQVMFALQNTPVRTSELPATRLTIEPVEAHSGAAKFDLTLFISEDGEGIGGALEYNTDLFDPETARQILRHYRALLEALLASPDESVAAVAFLSEGELRQQLDEWNRTEAEYPADRCVQQLFEEQAARAPEAVAVSDGRVELTYRELNERANRLARRLRRLGIGPEKLAAIRLERSVEMVVGLLGILKAGGAYLPIDPTYPAERQEWMLEDSRAEVILTQSRWKDGLPGHGARVICLDEDWPEIEREEASDLPRETTLENLAYVIYTSGSTGKPKGAMIEHRGVVNYLTWCRRAYPLQEGSGSVVHSSISFDLTVTSLLAPLATGKRALLAREDLGVEALGEALRREENLSLVKITPAHLQLLGQQLPPEEAAGRTRSFIIGGENLLSEQLAFWREHAPETILINEYGPTETVVGCCVYEVPRVGELTGVIPIGRPIVNTRLYILDSRLQPVPLGVVGELYIGGIGVGRGYLNRPDLTAERFLPDPFSDVPGARMYKSGDLARYRRDGNIECLGRADDQVKIRGYRVELGEIEAALEQHPKVRAAAVVARAGEGGAKRLIAFLASRAGDELVPAELRAYLQAQLPEYMVPTAFIGLPELPLTPNGKVDRRALPATEAMQAETAAEYVAPQSRIENLLTEIWRQVLGVERIGVNDNFFELGGDSILSIQVIARARQAGLQLTPKQLFEHPTVGGLAAVAGTELRSDAEQGPVAGEVPLTPIQSWFFEHDFARPEHWNQSVMLPFDGGSDPDSLKRTVRALWEHHDALRMRFEPSAQQGWRQYNAGIEERDLLSWIDLREIPDEDRPAAIERHAADIQRGLQLSNGSLLRVAYFDHGPDRAGRLMIAVHHLVIDGVSWRILMEDFQTAHRQVSEGRPVQLPLKSNSFRQWALALRDYAQGAAAQGEWPFWRELADERFAPLPVDFPGGTNIEGQAHSVTAVLDEEETQNLLHETAAALRVEINDLLLTALASALSRWTGSPRLLIDLEGHGREELIEGIDLSRTVGWFTSLYPVALEIGQAAQTSERLRLVKEQLRRIPNRGIGFGILKYLSDDPDIRKSLHALPPAEVSFNYLGQFDRERAADSPSEDAVETGGPERGPENQRTHLLDINGSVSGGRLQFEWTFSDRLHRPETIARLAESFVAALRDLIVAGRSGEGKTFVADDFSEFGWEQGDVQSILDAIGKTEN